jgi:hypothetical protein
MYAWLDTCGLTDPNGEPSQITNLIYGKSSSMLGWQLAWANCVFSFIPAAFYVNLPVGIMQTSKSIRAALETEYPDRACRTLADGALELVGLLECTPIGTELGQGIVSPTRPRTVRRVGLADPHPAALAHAMRRLFMREQRRELPIDEALLWPWIVFGCDSEEALLRMQAGQGHWLQVGPASVNLLAPWEELHDLALF